MSNDMSEIQRALGRLESSQGDIRRELRDGLKSIKDEFSSHKNEDQVNFSSIRNELRKHSEEREDHLDKQDVKLNALSVVSTRLEVQDENTRTIGKWIIAVFGSLAAAVGAAVIAALNGHIKIQ